jgi:hypothetical protein
VWKIWGKRAVASTVETTATMRLTTRTASVWEWAIDLGHLGPTFAGASRIQSDLGLLRTAGPVFWEPTAISTLFSFVEILWTVVMASDRSDVSVHEP